MTNITDKNEHLPTTITTPEELEKHKINKDILYIITEDQDVQNDFNSNLFYRIDERDYDILKTFLLYLNTMPDMIYGINGKNIRSSEIPVDMNIAEILRQI